MFPSERHNKVRPSQVAPGLQIGEKYQLSTVQQRADNNAQ
jgi:hypothetical protein